MKKMMKKLIAMAAALVMIVTLLPAVGAKAEEQPNPVISGNTGTVTIKKNYGKNENVEGQVGGVTFSLYKIASFTPGSNGSYSSWVLDNNYSEIEGLTPDLFGNISTTDLESKAKEIKQIIDSKNITATKEGTTASKTEGNDILGYVTISNIEFGYYLVVETDVPEGYVASKPFFISVPKTNKEGNGWEYAYTVEPKNEKIPPVEKEATTDTAGVGDTVQYVITGSTVPTYDDSYEISTLKYVITDTMSAGLTFTKETDGVSNITVEAVNGDQKTTLTENTHYSYAFDETLNKLTISLNGQQVKDQQGKQIVVTYNVTINANAVVGNPESGLNENDVNLEYSNKPGDTENSSDKKIIYSFKINVNKKGSDTNTALAGATFGLYSDENCTVEVAKATSKENTGLVDFGKSLKAGTYYLKELTAPNGYTLLTSPIKVEIYDANKDADTYEFEYKLNNAGTGTDIGNDGIVSVDVENQKGFSLPSTGGMGTYLFTIGGIVIMAGAAFALIAMKKRA